MKRIMTNEYAQRIDALAIRFIEWVLAYFYRRFNISPEKTKELIFAIFLATGIISLTAQMAASYAQGNWLQFTSCLPFVIWFPFWAAALQKRSSQTTNRWDHTICASFSLDVLGARNEQLWVRTLIFYITFVFILSETVILAVQGFENEASSILEIVTLLFLYFRAVANACYPPQPDEGRLAGEPGKISTNNDGDSV